jgi:hypothetical protein
MLPVLKYTRVRVPAPVAPMMAWVAGVLLLLTLRVPPRIYTAGAVRLTKSAGVPATPSVACVPENIRVDPIDVVFDSAVLVVLAIQTNPLVRAELLRDTFSGCVIVE